MTGQQTETELQRERAVALIASVIAEQSVLRGSPQTMLISRIRVGALIEMAAALLGVSRDDLRTEAERVAQE